LPAAGEPLDYGQDRCERVDDVLQRVSNLLQLVAVRALAAKSMAEHDKVGACIFKRTGGAPAVFHDRWDTFVSMAVRVQGAAGHAGRPWPALAAVLGGPDSLVPGQELRAIRSSPRIELSRAAGGPGFHGCSVVGVAASPSVTVSPGFNATARKNHIVYLQWWVPGEVFLITPRAYLVHGGEHRQPVVQAGNPQNRRHVRPRRDEAIPAPCRIGIVGDPDKRAQPPGVAEGHASQIEQQQPGMAVDCGPGPNVQAVRRDEVQLSLHGQDLDLPQTGCAVHSWR
jgi:hypothetical protein